MGTTDAAAGPRPPLVTGVWIRLSGRFTDRDAGPDLLDWGIAAVCFIAFTAPVLIGGGPHSGPTVPAILGGLAAAFLVPRRRWPVSAVYAVTAVYVAAALADVAFTPFVSNAGPNMVIAVFTAASRSRRRWSLTAAIVAGAATWASLPVALHLHPHASQDAVQLIAAVAAWLAGDMVRAIREYQRQLRVLEHGRDAERIRLSRAQERLRLSREVHDVVSHSLSAIAVQAGVARVVLNREPEQAGDALAAIEAASRSALEELRGLLRTIRDPEDPEDAGDSGELVTPGLADLPALVDRMRRPGLDVSYHSTGRQGPYRAAVEFSAYRIAQEALTNVTRHAAGARARVEIGHGGNWLILTVTDDGPGPAGAGPNRSPGGGLGLRGMRERAELLGGTLDAGPGPVGGFTVTARLPAGTGGSRA